MFHKMFHDGKTSIKFRQYIRRKKNIKTLRKKVRSRSLREADYTVASVAPLRQPSTHASPIQSSTKGSYRLRNETHRGVDSNQ